MRHLCFVSAMAVLAIVGCTGKGSKSEDGSESEPLPQPQDTIYTQRAAMMVYDYDPMQALQIVDSAVIVGNLSPWWADKNRARIYSQTRAGDRLDSLMHWTKGTRLDSARAIGERLLLHDSIKSDLAGQEDVLEMLVYTARQQNDTTLWLKRSQQLVEVCRQRGDETEALRNEAEMGAALCWMGKKSEGMAMLDRVIAALNEKGEMRKDKEVAAVGREDSTASANSSFISYHFSFNELDALIIALKRKIGVMTAEGQSVEVLPLARRIVMLLDDYEQHPAAYHDGSYREPSAEKRDDYIRFYRTQAENFIAAAYASLGQTDNMNATFERLENIVRDAETHEHQARYRALEQQMQRQQAEAHAEQQQARANNIRLQAVFFFVLLLLAVGFSIVLYRKNRDIRQKNRVLAQQLTELYDNTQPAPAEKGEEGLERLAEEKEQAEDDGQDDEALYRHIRDEVIRLQLYTDPHFSRQSIVKHFHLPKNTASRIFSQASDHTSISDFIMGCRLDHARRLLVNHPDMNIADIAAASGFSIRTTFTRCFKAKYGLTPSEFREQQERG